MDDNQIKMNWKMRGKPGSLTSRSGSRQLKEAEACGVDCHDMPKILKEKQNILNTICENK